jgi:hypothetical protein
MKSDTPSLAELEARLEKLERQNRRLKRLGLLFLLIAGSGFLLAQVPRKPTRAAPAPATPAATYDTLVVHRLELRDSAGKLQGVWNATDEGADLVLCDAAEKPRAALAVLADGPDLILSDAAGKPRAGLTVGAVGPVLAMFDAAGKLRAGLNVTALGPGLALYDTAGKAGAVLGEDSFSVTDAQGFKAIVGVTGTQTVATGESHTTSAAAVTLFGKDGKVIWRAP